jgi:hypothetical protein
MATTKAKREAKAEAVAQLLKILKPGQTVYTVLRHVSSSGMTRRIDLYVIQGKQPRFISGYVARALEYRQHKSGGLIVGGCGMDMGFHLVHSLGYALWGTLARTGTTKAATRLRQRLAVACRSYLCQGGAELPDPTLPADEWFGATGYALKHDWI